MQCKYCNYRATKVVYTRHDENKTNTYRRRECIKCGVRFTTSEHAKDDYKHARWEVNNTKRVLDK